jgi:hypothetical protein
MDKIEQTPDWMARVRAQFDSSFASLFFVSALTGENCEATLHFVAEEAAGHYRSVNREKVQTLKGNSEEKKRCC